jgi:hypothetical protein
MRLASFNLSPVLAIAVAFIFLTLWVDARNQIPRSVRFPLDAVVAIGLSSIAFRGSRGPRITYTSIHPKIRTWLVIALVATYVMIAWIVAGWVLAADAANSRLQRTRPAAVIAGR